MRDGQACGKCRRRKREAEVRRRIKSRVDLRRTTKHQGNAKAKSENVPRNPSLTLSAIDNSTAVEAIPSLKVGSDELENRLLPAMRPKGN